VSTRCREEDNRVVELLLAPRDSPTVSEFPADTTWRWELVVRPAGPICFGNALGDGFL
jgi:hypothetical protein